MTEEGQRRNGLGQASRESRDSSTKTRVQEWELKSSSQAQPRHYRKTGIQALVLSSGSWLHTAIFLRNHWLLPLDFWVPPCVWKCLLLSLALMWPTETSTPLPVTKGSLPAPSHLLTGSDKHTPYTYSTPLKLSLFLSNGFR